MAIFDALIDDMASRFGLGSNAAPLVREGLALIAGSPGGIAGFLEHCKSAGLSSLAGSWLGSSDPAPLAAKDLEGVVGAGGAFEAETDEVHAEQRRRRANGIVDGVDHLVVNAVMKTILDGVGRFGVLRLLRVRSHPLVLHWGRRYGGGDQARRGKMVADCSSAVLTVV